jgi:20S proteasome alpha/beta subunit
MTLIAAFRCHEGVVICADSQETRGDYIVAVDKIKPREAGEYDLVVGGSGNVAPLVDGLADAVERNVKRWTAGLNEEEAGLQIERTLLAYHTRHVNQYPDIPENKRLVFIICVRDRNSGRVYLWKTDATTLKRVEDYTLLGWNDELYEHELKRLYTENASALRCIMLGIHLFLLAKATTLYIGGDTQIIFMRDTGAWPADYLRATEPVMSMGLVLPAERVRVLEARMDKIGKLTAELLLTCPDTTIKTTEFTDRLVRFMEEVVRQRNEYVNEAFEVIHEHSVSGHGIYPFQTSPPEGIALEEADPIVQLLDAVKRRQSESQNSEDQP